MSKEQEPMTKWQQCKAIAEALAPITPGPFIAWMAAGAYRPSNPKKGVVPCEAVSIPHDPTNDVPTTSTPVK